MVMVGCSGWVCGGNERGLHWPVEASKEEPLDINGEPA